MNYLILANCQGNSYKVVMEALNPNIKCDFYITTDISKLEESDYHRYDMIFCQAQCKEFIPEIIQQNKKIILIPNIVFSGFHPDITYVGTTKDNNAIHGPMSSYQSAICLFCYKYGLSIDECIGYFNSYAFNKFGYYDAYQIAREILFEECRAINFDIEKYFYQWENKSPFMYSMNHPKLFVIQDVVIDIFERLSINLVRDVSSQNIEDPLQKMPIWPVYPEIANYLNISSVGSYQFFNPFGEFNLRSFIELSYQLYDNYQKDELIAVNIDLNNVAISINKHEAMLSNPYKSVAKQGYWRHAISRVEHVDIDPVISHKFLIKDVDAVATAGSCFAQHIAKTLSKEGYNYFIAEKIEGLSTEENLLRNFGVFSARFGNIYTVRQLLQLFHRAFNIKTATNLSFWKNNEGRFIDPYRPQVEPEGFEDLESALKDRIQHLANVRKMFESLDVFVFTLGLTEAWRYKLDGSIIPNPPSVLKCYEEQQDQYEFVNFNVHEVMQDMFDFLVLLRQYNPNARVILTVSPVPLIATYSGQHVLSATMYSKSVLRVVAQMACENFDNVDYFPSYEIITNAKSAHEYFEDDSREVKDIGVAHVMRIFKNHYLLSNTNNTNNTIESLKNLGLKEGVMVRNSMRKAYDIVCDEEIIDSND